MRKYSDEMDKMQQEAVRRMQEMQSRGKPTAPINITHEQNQQQAEKSNQAKQPAQIPVVHNEPEVCKSSAKQPSFFESIFHDKERSLILLLLLLLSTEKTDTSLMLALVYLLI